MDLTVVGMIYFRIFSLYFHNMDVKMKSAEPHLIDVDEMRSIFSLKNLTDEDLYTEVFFKPIMTDDKTPYQRVLIDIFDTVLTELYQKTWFVDYYSDMYLFAMVKHVLDNWYGKMVYYEITRPSQQIG
jgi:hypothetical protein